MPDSFDFAGLGLLQLGFQEIALQKIDEALQKDPENAIALQNKAVILERLLRLDEAIAIMTGYSRRDPTMSASA